VRAYTPTLALAAIVFLPGLAAAQAASAPLADALRSNESRSAKNLTAAAEEMPAEKYAYAPTPAQMSFGKVVVHLAQGNDFFCGTIAGVKAPDRSKVSDTDNKDVLVARLKETFDFCGKALANVDDSKLAEQLPFFGGKTVTRAEMEMVTAADWADHYSQSAIYLRLNGLLPPTAQKKPAA
jgi:DinB superfamily